MDLNNLDKNNNIININLNESKTGNIIHIRIQQRNTRKYLTIIEGLNYDFEFKAFLKKIKKQLSCNGSILKNKNQTIIQLQGDQRKNIKEYLIENNITNNENIKIHGF